MGLFLNGSGVIEATNAGGGDVKSVNGKIGEVILTAEDIKIANGSTVESQLANYVVRELAIKNNITILSGSKGGIITIEKIEGRTLYRRLDGTYTDKWEEGITLENVKDNVEVVSCGENLCDNKLQLKEINADDGKEYERDNVITTVNYFKIPSDKNFYVRLYYKNDIIDRPISGRWYDKNKNYIGKLDTSEPTNRTPKGVYLRLRFLCEDGTIEDLENYKFMLSYEDMPYEPYKEDKTTIQLKEPLRGLPNGVCDELLTDGTLIRRIGIGLYKEGDEGKQNLVTNKTFTYYQLNDPIIEETIPLKSLQCFTNGSITINSKIQPFVTIKYPTDLNNRLQMVEQDINKSINVESKPYDKGDFSVNYEYYENGKIKKEIITGDVERITEYSYIQEGFKNEGKILMEIVKEKGEKISRVFSYDDKGKIINIQAVTDTNI